MAEEQVEKISGGKLHAGGICTTCGKPVRNFRRGSFTAWIFQSNSCSCASGQESGNKIRAERAPRQFVTSPGMEENAETAAAKDLPDFGERYLTICLIGRGGMGSVYKVRDLDLNKTFAVKVLKSELVEDREAVGRFRQEARAAARLTHANLVAVYDEGELPSGLPYIVMDYIDGENLASIIEQDGFVPVDRALNIFLQAAEVIEYAHAKGIIHRDLKPSNIMLTRTESGAELVHLVDFGIAKILYATGESLSNLTQTGDVFGSPVYMSPEQCRGEKLDERSDMYSFGCVMYETLLGKPPFSCRNPLTAMLDHLQKSPPVFKAANPDANVSVTLETIVLRCLEKSADERYQNFEDLKIDLAALQEGKDLVSSRRQSVPLPLRCMAGTVDALIVGALGALIYTLLLATSAPMMLVGSTDKSYMDVLLNLLPLSLAGGFTLGVLQSAFGFAPLWLLYDVFTCNSHVMFIAVYSRLSAVLLILAAWFYFAGFESSKFRATPGKKLFGLQVVDERKRRVSFKQATKRYFLKTLTILQPLSLFAFMVISYCVHTATHLAIPGWLKLMPYYFAAVCILQLVSLVWYLVAKKKSVDDELPPFFGRLWHEVISGTSVVRASRGSKSALPVVVGG